MPLILFNFPQTQLISYITETRFDEDHPLRVYYRYDKPNIVEARKSAIMKAIDERRRLKKLTNDIDLAKQVRIVLEYVEIRPEVSAAVKLKKHCIFDAAVPEDCDPLLSLDFESAIWQASRQPVPTIELETERLTYVLIEPRYDELLGLIADATDGASDNRR